MKKGPPIIAVTIPIGNSAGTTIVRAIKSAANSRLEPNNAEAYLGIGLTYWNMDEKDLAISSWKKSMRIKPENNESQGWLILSEQGS